MTIFLTVFQAVATLLGIGLLGFYIISRKLLPKNALSALSSLSIDIALPCLIFVNIISGFNPLSSPGWWRLPLWWAAFTLFIGAMTFLLSLTARKENRREFAAALFYQNALFLPLAILGALFGRDSKQVIDLFFFTIFFGAFFFSTCRMFFSKGAEGFKLQRATNPVLMATLTAIIFKFTHFDLLLPRFSLSAARMIGDMAIPLLMLVLRGAIYSDLKSLKALQLKETLKFIFCKNIIFPMAAIGLLLFFRPPQEIALLLALQSMLPPITPIPIMVERSGGNAPLVSQFMVGSFIFSLISIPAFFWLFTRLFAENKAAIILTASSGFNL